MTIVPSPRATIQNWLARLGAPEARTRETAVARLRLQGRGALLPLLEFLPQAPSEARRTATFVLEALEGDADALRALLALCADAEPEVATRALEAALERATDSPDAAAACVARLGALGLDPARPIGLRSVALSGLLRLLTAGTVEALEPLLGVLLDEAAEEALRLAAAPVLEELAARERAPVVARLATSASAALRERLGRAERARPPQGAKRPRPTGPGERPEPRPRATHDDWADALGALARHGSQAVSSVASALASAGDWPDEAVARTVAALGGLGPPALPALQHALDGLSRAQAPEAAARAEAKAVLHLALAHLDSRLALYDLRDMLAARPPRALTRLLTAAERIGDASVAVELLRLVAEAPGLRDACTPAFAAIVERERLTRRHRAWKALPEAARPALGLLWPRR